MGVSLIPGGTLAIGTYHVAGAYKGLLCPTGTGISIGSAQLSVDAAQNILFKWVALKKVNAGDAGVRVGGTYWLQPGANGTLTRTELCDAGRKGTSESGTFLQSGADLTFVFSGGAEIWKKE